MLVVTSCYGRAYAPFLAVFLRSVRRSNPAAQVTVVYDELGERLVAAFARLNPAARFLRRRSLGGATTNERIGGKLLLLQAALEGEPDGAEVVLLDCDMIARGDLGEALAESVDVAVTLREDRWPLNTGFVGLRWSETTRLLLEVWRRESEAIRADPALTTSAAADSGGVTQHALRRLLDLEDPRPPLGVFVSYVDGRAVRVARLPCAIWNQVESVPLSAPARVLHYKGPWRRILLKDRPFPDKRPRETSAEMAALWRAELDAEERKLGMRLLPARTRLRRRLKDLAGRVTGRAVD